MWLLRARAGAGSGQGCGATGWRGLCHLTLDVKFRWAAASKVERTTRTNTLNWRHLNFSLSLCIFNIFARMTLIIQPGLSPLSVQLLFAIKWRQNKTAKWCRKLNFYYLPYCFAIKLMIIMAIAWRPQASIKLPGHGVTSWSFRHICEAFQT